MIASLTPAQSALAARYTHLVDAVVRTAARRYGRDADELRGPAHLGLVEAASRFEPKIGADFEAFASFRIRGAVADTVKKEAKAARRQRLAERSAACDALDDVVRMGNPLTDGEEEIQARLDAQLGPVAFEIFMRATCNAWRDAHDDIERYGEYAKAIEALNAALPELPPKQRRVTELLFFHEGSVKATAEEMGIGDKACRILKAEALKRLQSLLRQRGVEAAPPSAP